MYDMRISRYTGYVDTDWLMVPVTVVGVGAIGRQVALQCGAMGFQTIQLVDHDIVEAVNMGTQGYRPDQINVPKVDATAQDILRIFPECTVVTHNKKFDTEVATDVRGVVFVCVDSMTARREIAEWIVSRRQRYPILIDGRMRRTTIRIASCDQDSFQAYLDNLYTDAEALNERCTAQTTIFMASVAAGLMINRFIEHKKEYAQGYLDQLFDPGACMIGMAEVDQLDKASV